MPRKIRWPEASAKLRLKPSPLVYAEPAIRIAVWSGVPDHVVGTLANHIAQLLAQYAGWKEHTQATIEEHRAALKAIRKVAILARLRPSRDYGVQLHNMLVSADPETEYLLGVALKKLAASVEFSSFSTAWCLSQYVGCPSLVEQAVCGALALSGTSRGPRRDEDLRWTLNDLADVYEAVTGFRATHTRYKELEYTSQPQSPFGRLCAAFFHEADPSLPVRRIGTELTRLLPRRRRYKLGLSSPRRDALEGLPPKHGPETGYEPPGSRVADAAADRASTP